VPAQRLAHLDHHEVLGLVAQVVQRAFVVHMFDETGHADEGLPPHRRGAHRLAIGEEVAGMCAEQDAVGVVQREEGADRQFIRCEPVSNAASPYSSRWVASCATWRPTPHSARTAPL
jgi:hypothetical protein